MVYYTVNTLWQGLYSMRNRDAIIKLCTRKKLDYSFLQHRELLFNGINMNGDLRILSTNSFFPTFATPSVWFQNFDPRELMLDHSTLSTIEK